MAERLHGRQNDNSLAGPPHSPLRYHRNRKRQLALQEPWRGSPDNPRSRRLRNPDQLRRRERYRPDPSLKGVPFGCKSGVPIGCRLTLYAAETDAADHDAFIKRGREDRHQFRFIVAPEDGDRLSDLRAFTRDVMSQMEEDLGTRLDWVAIDHFNTGHPHSHVVVRGRDDLGKDLIIAQDYITDGLRQRAQERATLELGPETDLELRAKLEAEVSAERFTRIDRAMFAESNDGVLDMRPETGQAHANFDRTLRIGRLQTLERYGLATQSEPGLWALSERLEAIMRDLGERHDIIKAINRALADPGEEGAPGSFVPPGEAQT